MDLNRLTLRSREALTQAQRVAGERNHQQVEPEHLLDALLSDPEGVIYPLLHALGLSPRAVRDPLEERLAKMPKVYGPQQEVTLSMAARHVWSGRSPKPPPWATTTSPRSTCSWPCWRALPRWPAWWPTPDSTGRGC